MTVVIAKNKNIIKHTEQRTEPGLSQEFHYYLTILQQQSIYW